VTLSIITVNYRSWGHLENCLGALFDGAGSTEFQVIVVDNHSADGRLDEYRRRFPQVEFIESDRNGGFSHGCNLGARTARGDQLLFMNPDVLATPAQVRELSAALRRNPDIAILSSVQLDAAGRRQKAFDVFPELWTWFKPLKALLRVVLPRRYPDPRKEHHAALDCDWVSGSLLLIRREHFDALGGWSEDYWMYMEDCDLCYRARSRGLRVAFVPQPVFIHVHGGASRRTPAITALTKIETTISKHVYVRRHSRGLRSFLNHAIVATTTLLPQLLYGLVDLLTLHRIGSLKTRARTLAGLLAYYLGAPWRRGWCSSRVTS
jgi:GT2 family glycosyltransferase